MGQGAEHRPRELANLVDDGKSDAMESIPVRPVFGTERLHHVIIPRIGRRKSLIEGKVARSNLNPMTNV